MRERSTCPRQLAPTIVVDNGPEFAGRVLDAWAYRRGITLAFIQPGKPTQDAFVESFNSRLRDECLNAHWFVTVTEAQLHTEVRRSQLEVIRVDTDGTARYLVSVP